MTAETAANASAEPEEEPATRDGVVAEASSAPVADVVDTTQAAGEAKALKPGDAVEIIGTAMSGSEGILESYVDEKQRWKVKFASGTSKNFKAESLRVLAPKRTRGKKRKKQAAADAADPAEATAATAARAEDRTSADPQPQAQASGAQIDCSVSEIMERLRETPGEILPSEAAAEGLPPQGAKPLAAEPPGEGEGVHLAGQHFASHKALVAHVKALQTRLEADTDDADGVLEPADRFLMFHLAILSAKTVDKIQAPVRSIRYAAPPNFKTTKCFNIVYADGTMEPFSWSKIAKEIFQRGPGQTAPPRPGADGGEGGAAKKRPKIQEPEPVAEAEFRRDEVGLKLISELALASGAPHADKWEYPLMDEEFRCFAGYLKCPFEPALLKSFFKKAREGTDWGRPVDPRSGEPIPRKTAWMVAKGCACTYRYGGVDVEAKEFPPWMLEVMEAYMPLCGLPDKTLWPNSCNLNLYEDGKMAVGWHADDEKLFQGKFRDARIISVSLGQPRLFELRTIGEEDDGTRPHHAMKLRDGDLCTMEGMTQKHYQHRVAKDPSLGPRINLTWRWVLKHKADCPCSVQAQAS